MRISSFHRKRRRATKNKILSQEAYGFSFQTSPTPSSRYMYKLRYNLQFSFGSFLAMALPRQVKNWNFKEPGNCAILSYLFGYLILQLKSQDPSSSNNNNLAGTELYQCTFHSYLNHSSFQQDRQYFQMSESIFTFLKKSKIIC